MSSSNSNQSSSSVPVLPILAFTHIKSDLKKSIDVDLSRLTFIVGPNRSYKTSILQSVELAVTRQLHVENKKSPVSTPSKLLRFAANEADGITIRLQSASGNLSFVLPINEETGNAKEPVPRYATDTLQTLTDEDWANAFPMQAVREMLYFDARQTRQAIVRIFGGDAARDALTTPMGLSDIQKDMWAAGLRHAKDSLESPSNPNTADPATLLAAISSWAHDQKPKKTKEANKHETGLSTAKTRAATPGIETLPALEEQYKRAVEAESSKAAANQSQAVQIAVLQGELDRTLIEIADLKNRVTAKNIDLLSLETQEIEAVAKLDVDEAELEKTRPELGLAAIASKYDTDRTDLSERINYGTRLIADLQSRIKSGRDECPFGDKVEPGTLQKHIDRIVPQVAKRRVELETLECERVQAEQRAMAHRDAAVRLATTRQTIKQSFEFERSKVAATLEVLNRQIAMRQEIVNIAQNRIAAETAVSSAGSGHVSSTAAPFTYAGPSSADLKSRIDKIKDALVARQQYEVGMTTVRRLHSESAACKVIEGEAHEIMQRILVSCKSVAEQRVNEFMPAAFRAELDLSDEDCAWRVFGSDGDCHDSSSSGSEFGSLIVALACALPGRLKILALDDKDLHAFDPENIQALWTAIEHAVAIGALTQALVAHNRPDEAPSRDKGWLILQQIRLNSAMPKDKSVVLPRVVDQSAVSHVIEVAPGEDDLAGLTSVI